MLANKSVALIGFGKSNQALYTYLKSKDIHPTIRVPNTCTLPPNSKVIVGKDYLNTSEDVIFRSPVIRPDKIKARGKIYTEIGYFLEKTPSFKIGITGSDGKTTTSTLIHKILEAEGKASYLGGNIGTPLITYLDKMQADDISVCELSSFQLFDMMPHLDVSVITNISQNHLDWHIDMDEYKYAKENILINSKKLILCLDQYEKRQFPNKEVTYFSKDKPITLNKDASYIYTQGGYIVRNGTRLFPIDEIKLKGEFNLLNYLCAIATTYHLVSLDKIVQVARTFSGVSNRMEQVANINGVTFIDSSIDSTPTRTNATLSALDLKNSVVILGGYDKNLDYSILKNTLSGVRAIVLCGENSQKIYTHIKNHKNVIFAPSLLQATREAYNQALPCGTVVLSPASASFDMFENYKEKSKEYRKAINTLR
ncbi:MAG: UDP-N-acetylmuramoyl-L-alanine--D-glutamate ligase [Clostridia bacterium]|nr:UDP-N-acetylmuramoyl-L-alanine--D-glutamate ligase [Clostridia bacterium]